MLWIDRNGETYEKIFMQKLSGACDVLDYAVGVRDTSYTPENRFRLTQRGSEVRLQAMERMSFATDWFTDSLYSTIAKNDFI